MTHTITHMQYHTIRIHEDVMVLLKKARGLLITKEGRDETMIEILRRLLEQEVKRLEQKR